MNNLLDPKLNKVKNQQNSQYSTSGIYVREDDQDWGSAGMNDIEQEYNTNE